MPGVELAGFLVPVWLRIDRRARSRRLCRLAFARSSHSAALAGCGHLLRASTVRDRDCLARVMYFESIRSSDEGMLAVGTVVMNRVESDKYPNSVCAVVGQNNQFAPGALSRDDAGGRRAATAPTASPTRCSRQAAPRRRQGDVLPHRRPHLQLHQHALRRGRRRQRLLRAQADAGEELHPAHGHRAGGAARFDRRVAAGFFGKAWVAANPVRDRSHAAGVAAGHMSQPRRIEAGPSAGLRRTRRLRHRASIEALILASN